MKENSTGNTIDGFSLDIKKPKQSSMKIESIELWSERKIILRDTTDLQHEIEDVEVFQNEFEDKIQLDEQDLTLIKYTDWSEFAKEKDEDLVEYVNMLLQVSEITFLKHARIIGESNREKYERITTYRNALVLENDEIARKVRESGSRSGKTLGFKKYMNRGLLLQGLKEILEELK